MADNNEKEVGLATEIFRYMKRFLIIMLIALIVEPIIFYVANLIYLSNYDYAASIEQTGLYTFSDSDGNVISSDITPDEMKEILQIINGKDKNNNIKD